MFKTSVGISWKEKVEIYSRSKSLHRSHLDVYHALRMIPIPKPLTLSALVLDTLSNSRASAERTSISLIIPSVIQMLWHFYAISP